MMWQILRSLTISSSLDVLFDENVKFQFKRGTIIFATKQYSETFCFKSQVDAVLKNDTTIW